MTNTKRLGVALTQYGFITPITAIGIFQFVLGGRGASATGLAASMAAGAFISYGLR